MIIARSEKQAVILKRLSIVRPNRLRPKDLAVSANPITASLQTYKLFIFFRSSIPWKKIRLKSYANAVCTQQHSAYTRVISFVKDRSFQSRHLVVYGQRLYYGNFPRPLK